MISTSTRRLGIALRADRVTSKGFTTTRWRVSELVPGEGAPHALDLQLSLTERAAYRFNLTSPSPRLFVNAGDPDEAPCPVSITASQEVAAAWLDGEQRVLEVAMPLAIQAWLESYLARHGEAPDQGPRKQRKGAGRAREETP